MTEGEWKWMSTHADFSYSAWAPGEPSDKDGHEHCLQLYTNENYHWNGEVCSSRFSFICEKAE